MVNRNTVFTAIALLVPACVFAVTALTDSADSVKASAASPPSARPAAVAAEPVAQVPEDSHQVMTVSVNPRAEKSKSKSTPSIEAFTEPYRDIAVAAPEMGTLAELKVSEGDIVKQGDLLAVMDDDVLQASLAVARRTMSAEGMLKSAQADLNMKKVELEKLTQLRERNHASQQELSRIETELLVAEARLLSVQEDLAVKRLEFDRIEAQVAQRKILAPIDGIISELFREKGEFVSPSDPTIARIVQLDPLLVVFSLPLGQRKEVMKDQRVTLKIGEDERVQEGVVEYVSPTSDPSNSSVRVKVRIPNSEGHFQSGERAVLATSPAEQVSPGEQPESSPLARREL
jgi:RND family efflux transporter MFP subunit